MTVVPTNGSTRARARFCPPPPRTIGLALGVVAVDQLTKHWAVSSLPGRPPVHVIWTLRWNLSFNRGMSFSRFQGLGPLIAIVAIGIAVWVAITVGRLRSPLAAIAGGLIIGGALGNVIDRLFRGDSWLHGGVVDFIDLQWFPIFNVADSAINIGGALFLIWSLLANRSHAP